MSVHKYISYALPALSGILIAIGLSPTSAPLLMWVGLVPLFFFLLREKCSGTDALFAGLIAGSVVGISLLAPLATTEAWWWLAPESFLFEYRALFFARFVDFVAILGIGGFFAIFSILYHISLRKIRGETERPAVWTQDFGAAFGLALLWTLVEYARATAIGFTWGHLGYGLFGDIFAMQFAAVAGIYGLSFAVVAVNVSVVRSLSCRSLRPLIPAMLVIVVVYSYGVAVVLSENDSPSKSIAASIIHPALTTEESATAAGFEAVLSLFEKAAETSPDIVVAPENAFPFIIFDRETGLPVRYSAEGSSITGYYDRLNALSLAYPETALVFGAHTRRDNGRFNSIMVMRNGRVEDGYDKRALLIFGEKGVPFVERTRDVALVPGAGSGAFSIAGHTATGIICSEVAYPRLASSQSSAFIVNISNDNIFESPLVGEQNHIQAVFRAIENRQHVLRSVKGGISSIIDPLGMVVVQSGNESAPEVLEANIAVELSKSK